MLTTNVLFIDACPICTVITYSTDWKQGRYTFTILCGVVICQRKNVFTGESYLFEDNSNIQ